VTEVDWNPTPAKLKTFGWVACAVFGALGVAAYTGHFALLRRFPEREPAASLVFAGVGAVSALFSLVFPRANRPLYVAVTAVGLPVRWVASTIALAVAFFLVVTPVGWVRRLVAGDPLHRRWEPAEKTYWVTVRPTRPPEDYFRLF
jgi:hypothetical protein